MAHDIDQFQLVSASLITLMAGGIAILLYYRKRKTGIRALNLLIYLFTSISLLGLFEIISIFFHEQLPLFSPDEEIITLIFHPVRVANLATIIILYIFAENIMSQKVDRYRLAVVTVLLSGMFFVGIVNWSLGRPTLTNEVLGFGNNTKFDEFLFDILQFFVVSFIAYTFALQFQFNDSPQFSRYIALLLLASGLYLFAMVLEVMEHLFTFLEVDAFITAFPTIALLAYIYIRYPRMIFMVPTDVKFLQLVNVKSGIPVYVAEFEEDTEAMDFLIGPGLSSIRTMLSELLTEEDHIFQLKSFSYSNGYLIFEEGTGLFALLQTDRLSKLLLTSLQYFIHEFENLFGSQLRHYHGEIEAVNGVTPDDLIKQCIPIVQAKPILSSMEQ